MLIAAIVLISAALLLYSSGVWAERRGGGRRPPPPGRVGAGGGGGAAGPWVLRPIARAGSYETTGVAALLTTLMAVTGALALVLMAVHLAWALVVLWKGSDNARRTFHRFSLVVWALWLVPYFTGMASATVR